MAEYSNSDDKLLNALIISTAWTKTALDSYWKTETAQQIAASKQDSLSVLRAIGKSGDLETIIAAEKYLVVYDLKEYANSKDMITSLGTARDELKAIEDNIELLKHPKQYKAIDTSLQQSKARDSGDLPIDGARQAFSSHTTRLGNYARAKSDDSEKAIVEARRENIRIAKNLYIARQEKALGRPEQTAPRRDMDKNPARMHTDAAGRVPENIQALRQNPALAGRSPEALEKLAYWRGVLQEDFKDEPPTARDAALAKFDEKAKDPAFLEKLKAVDTAQEVKPETPQQERKDTLDQSR